MHTAGTTEGQRGHADLLTTDQAATLLGCTARHVRRLIASGQLAGAQRPYRTARTAVDDYRRRQQAHAGTLVDTADTRTDPGDSAEPDEGAGRAQQRWMVEMLYDELAAAREQAVELGRAVGRLEAELAQCRHAHGQRGHEGRGGGPLARLVPWLRG